MQTAYALHFSEGIPKRMIVSTSVNNAMVTVSTVECDFSWKADEVTRRSYTKKIRKSRLFETEPETLFHTQLRKRMTNEYNWRFEVYHPFSDTV